MNITLNRFKKTVIAFICIIIIPSWVHAGGTAVGTQFTYQGELIDNGSPANGSYDLLIQLHVSQNSNASLDSNAFEDVEVVNGLFTVDLDYGDASFSGDERYLRILVRPGDSDGSYEVLSPRQRINVTPYAIQSAFTENGTSPWTDNGGDISYADQVFVGTRNTVSSSQLTVQSADNVSPLRVFVNGTTRLIVKENGGTSIGINSDAPDRGLFVRGNASQGLDSHGFVKAGISLTCNNSGSSELAAFNNQNAADFTVNDGLLAGQCEITVPFDISDSYVLANTSNSLNPLGVNCLKNNTNNTVTCSVWDPLADIRTLGIINVLLF